MLVQQVLQYQFRLHSIYALLNSLKIHSKFLSRLPIPNYFMWMILTFRGAKTIILDLSLFFYRPIYHSKKLLRFYSTQKHIWKTLAQAHLFIANLFCTWSILDETFQNIETFSGVFFVTCNAVTLFSIAPNSFSVSLCNMAPMMCIPSWKCFLKLQKQSIFSKIWNSYSMHQGRGATSSSFRGGEIFMNFHSMTSSCLSKRGTTLSHVLFATFPKMRTY